jgi:heat shock protein HslJ
MQHTRLNAAIAPVLMTLLMTAGLAPAAEEGSTVGGTRTEPVTQPGTAAAVATAANPATPSPATPSLEEATWQLVAYRAGDRLVEIAAGPHPPRLRFEAGRVSGSPGCNRIGGTYTLADGQLSFKPTMQSTMMACPEPQMQQEQAVGLAMTRVATYRLDGDRLDLLDATDTLQLRLMRLKPAPLVGQVWQLTGYNNGKQAIVSTQNGTEITLEFRDDGTLGGSDGCNRYMSGYTLDKAVLTLGPLARTRMACKGPKGATEQARDYAAALETVAGYRIEGGELTLLSREGKPAARFIVKAPPPAPAAVPEDRAPATGGSLLQSQTPASAPGGGNGKPEESPPQSPPISKGL